MRNQWYPKKKAEYMTPSRFHELGLTHDDIGERDTAFGTVAAEEFEEVQESVAPAPIVYTASVRLGLLCPRPSQVSRSCAIFADTNDAANSPKRRTQS
jgi:hypothetical protein